MSEEILLSLVTAHLTDFVCFSLTLLMLGKLSDASMFSSHAVSPPSPTLRQQTYRLAQDYFLQGWGGFMMIGCRQLTDS